MAIGYRNKSNADNVNTTAMGVTKPTGFASTDILIVTLNWANTGSPTLTVPSGWTAIGTVVATNITVAAYSALGSVASTAFALSVSRDNGNVCAAYTGVDTTTPVDATGTTSSNSGAASITANAVTIATDQALHLIAAGSWASGVYSATGFTVQNNGAAPNQAASILYNLTPKSVGSTGTVTVNNTVSTGQVLVVIPFALRPAAGGSTSPVAKMYVQSQAVRRASFF
jgi:hypothetical protein